MTTHVDSPDLTELKTARVRYLAAARTLAGATNAWAERALRSVGDGRGRPPRRGYGRGGRGVGTQAGAGDSTRHPDRHPDLAAADVLTFPLSHQRPFHRTITDDLGVWNDEK